VRSTGRRGDVPARRAGAGVIREWGRQPLAHDFYLLAHDEHSGRSRVRPRIVGLGLAAALIGELILGEPAAAARSDGVPAGGVKVMAWGERLVVCDREPPADDLSRAVYEAVLGDNTRTVQWWITALSGTSLRWVRRRMYRAGLLERRPRQSRWALASRTAWVPTDPGAAALPWARLTNRLQRGERLGEHDGVLLGLLQATGLRECVLDEVPPQARRRTSAVLAELPEQPALLVAHLDAAVADAVLAHRA
jgi:hypothetical protein